MFVFGIVLGLPGTVLAQPDVVARFGLTMADRGALIAALFVGLLVGSFVSGPAVDAIGQRASLAWSSLLVAACFPILIVASTMSVAAAALAAIGLASAGINTASNTLSSDLFPTERARRMNGIAIAVGFGGLAMPAATAFAAPFVSWRGVVGGASVLALAVALASTRVPMPPARTHASGTVAALMMLVRRRGFAWFGLLIMLAAANEASYAGWIASYLTASGLSAVTATTLLATHWLGMITGRALFAGRVDRAKQRAVIRGALAGAAVALVFASSHVTPLLAAAPFVVGVAIAVVMPTSMAFAGDRYPGSPGTLFGTLLTLAQAGAIALPALIGVVAQEAGVRAGMSLLVVNGIAIAAIARRAGKSA
jgi:fucose permease